MDQTVQDMSNQIGIMDVTNFSQGLQNTDKTALTRNLVKAFLECFAANQQEFRNNEEGGFNMLNIQRLHNVNQDVSSFGCLSLFTRYAMPTSKLY